MPHISVTLWKGRDKEALEKVANTLRDSLKETWGPEALSVSIREVDPSEFEGIVRERLEDEELVLTSDYIK